MIHFSMTNTMTTKYLTTAMLSLTLLGVIGITTGIAYGDEATPHYTGEYDLNSNSVSSTGGDIDVDTYSDGWSEDIGDGVLNLGDNGVSCTADAGKVTVDNKQLELHVSFSGDQTLTEDGYWASTYSEIGVRVYGGANNACNFVLFAYQLETSPHDDSIPDIAGYTGNSYTGTFYAGAFAKASSYGAFGNSAADIDATANSIKIVEYSP